MKQILDDELKEIIVSYGLSGLSFDGAEQVDPDTMLYYFHDTQGDVYVLVATDYLGGYDEIKLPHEFVFDYYGKDHISSFVATRRCAYIDGAKKVAKGYLDNKHYLTVADTGDVCMLFQCSDVVRPS